MCKELERSQRRSVRRGVWRIGAKPDLVSGVVDEVDMVVRLEPYVLMATGNSKNRSEMTGCYCKL